MTTPKTARAVRTAMVHTERRDFLVLTEADAPAQWGHVPLVALPAADYDLLTAQLREARRLLEQYADGGTPKMTDVWAFLSSNTEES